MFTCFVFATIISFLSIFLFFGTGLDMPKLKYSLNMFELMFGADKDMKISGYNIHVKTNPEGGMTFLFVLQIIIMILAVVVWILTKKDYIDDKYVAIFSGISGGASLIALILSFCTKPICDANSSEVKLGFGPILYSILHIISVALIIIGLIKYYKEQSLSRAYRLKVIRERQNHPYSNSMYSKQPKNSLSENEKAELLIKYKSLLDSGVISKEEFVAKKKEIL